jgi:hypothetical protein
MKTDQAKAQLASTSQLKPPGPAQSRKAFRTPSRWRIHFQISATTTGDRSTGKKKTARKKPRARMSRFRMIAVRSENPTMKPTCSVTNQVVFQTARQNLSSRQELGSRKFSQSVRVTKFLKAHVGAVGEKHVAPRP